MLNQSEHDSTVERGFGKTAQSKAKNLNTGGAWNNRQTEWYNAERRLIFAANVKAQEQRWLKELRDLVKYYNEAKEKKRLGRKLTYYKDKNEIE